MDDMENMDGIESMSRILGESRDIPVIINTGYSEYQTNFMSWAAEAYVLKSADVAPLMEAVEKTLAKHGLNYVIEKYLPQKLKKADSFLP